MATVTGITAERAQEIENNSVVSGSISNAGHLLLTKQGGAVIDAGEVVASPLASWPIGSIFLTVSSANPSTLLGGGTWSRWGQGRVPVSLDSTQAEFDTVNDVGGAKTHTLTEAEMPSHAHGVGTLATSSTGAHTHDINRRANASGTTQIAAGAGLSEADGTTASAGAHTHTISGTSAATGSGAAHNILQPYITCYMWQRTG